MRLAGAALAVASLGSTLAARLSLKRPTEQSVSQAIGQDTCDVTATGAVCFAGHRPALVPAAVSSGLVGHWTFDETAALDSSGNSNHGATEILHGPSPVGAGYSALFKQNFLMVPNSVQFQSADFSYSFWVYLLDDAASQTTSEAAHWCPLLRKGIHDVQTDQFASSPAILFSPQTGHLRASITTSITGTQDGEYLQSNARLSLNRWMHLAVVHHSQQHTMLLYVNGILDSALNTKGEAVPNSYPLYVGGDPFTAEQCRRPLYMDELRFFSRAIAPHELKAEAALALGGTDPSYVRLGCLSCTLLEAVKSCPPTRHVCSSLELHTGGYQIARTLGWLKAGAHIWTEAACEQGAAAPGASAGQMGLSMCCEGTS